MIFKDEVIIFVKSGKGGDGAATFRREKYIPYGGPDGGDGGDGGDVILKVNKQLRTLSHLHNNQKFKAENGENGMSNKKHGKNGKSLIIEVPPGTMVFDDEKNELLCDLTEDKQEYIVVEGGKGGRGNVWFKSSTNQTPFYAEKGKPAKEKKLRLELKMIAHVGLVGFPNAGKSTLVSKITHAKPKIANYPFTTLNPIIGVMTIDDAYTSLLIADIPGIIEGAHEGRGLGIEFLKHIERTKVLLYVLDINDDPYNKFKILRKELKSYSELLFKRKFLIVLNKIDLINDNQLIDEIVKQFKGYKKVIYKISALTGEGLKTLKQAIFNLYKQQEEQENKMIVKDNKNENTIT